MRIDAALAELRRDPAPQHRAQIALEAGRDAWRGSPGTEALLSELAEFGSGAPLGACPLLDSALADCAVAGDLLAGLFGAMLAVLRDHPLGHVPLRHQYAHGIAVLQLASAGRANLSLLCYEARGGQGATAAQTVCFVGGERHELCLAGAADVRFCEILREEPGRADLDCGLRRVSAGERLVFASARHTKIVETPRRRLVVLRLARDASRQVPAREYRLADGALVHVASGERAESRDEMAAAVLGAMGRSDAVPALAELARTGSAHLRWQALRQMLSLDSAAGFALLSEFASESEDPLAAPADALRSTLIERHPELARWSRPCPV